MNISDAPAQGVPAPAPAPAGVPAPLLEALIPKAEISDAVDGLTGEVDAGQSANGTLKRRFPRQVSKKVKRLRRNRRLRRILMPKNALMSLNELMGSSLTDFNITPEERGFVANVLVNNTQYEGRGKIHLAVLLYILSRLQPQHVFNISSNFSGISKIAAKNNASEKALRDIIIQRMIQTPRASAIKTSTDPQQQSNTGKSSQNLILHFN